MWLGRLSTCSTSTVIPPTRSDGTLFWDMFSKDGIEVTSGLYIYVAEYPGGTQTGHFAILR